MKKFERILIEQLWDTLEDVYNPNDLIDDNLHYNAYNEYHIIIGVKKAKDILNDYDVFKAISEIIEYENFHFGAIETNFQDPEEVANMLFYIKGSELINELDLYEYEEVTQVEALERVRKYAKEHGLFG